MLEVMNNLRLGKALCLLVLLQRDILSRRLCSCVGLTRIDVEKISMTLILIIFICYLCLRLPCVKYTLHLIP
jgi:hypothetical protein